MAEQDGPGKEGQERRECWMKVEKRDGAQGGQVMTVGSGQTSSRCATVTESKPTLLAAAQ